MIKRFDKITLGDFYNLEIDGSISQFKLWWNILPSKLFLNRIKHEIEKVYELISNEKLNTPINEIEYEIRSFNAIQILTICYEIIYNHLELGANNKTVIERILLDRRNRRRLRYKSESLANTIIQVQKFSNPSINIKNTEDVEDLRKQIELRRDRYDQNIGSLRKQNNEKDKKYLIEIASSYAAYSGFSSIGISKMTIVEFAYMKREIDKQIKEKQKQIAKQKHG